MMSVNTQRAIIKDIQGFSGDELRKFLKTLIDEIVMFEDIQDRKVKTVEFQDIKDCLDIVTDTKPERYHNLDTSVRDSFMNAYLKMHI